MLGEDVSIEIKHTTDQPLLERKESQAEDIEPVKNALKKQIRIFSIFYSLTDPETKNPFETLQAGATRENLFKKIVAAHITIIISFLPAESLVEFSLVNKSAYSLSTEYLRTLTPAVQKSYLPKTVTLLANARTASQNLLNRHRTLCEREKKVPIKTILCLRASIYGSMIGMLITGTWLALESSARNFNYGVFPAFLAFCGCCVTTCCGSNLLDFNLLFRQRRRLSEYNNFNKLIEKLDTLSNKKVSLTFGL